MGNAVSKAFNNVSKAANSAVGNVQKGAQQFGQGAQQLGSGDLKGLQTMGGAVVNTGSDLYGNMADINRASIDALYETPGGGMLKGTPLDGMIRGNLKGGIGSLEGMVRGNIAGIQDLPTDIGAGVQQGLDQIGGAAQDLLGGLGDVLGGGGGGAGGGVSAPQYYKDLAQKQAEYGMSLPDQFQKYEGERFTTPGENTLRGEGILAGRYDQRFGLGGTNPFADAKTAVDEAANYSSTYAGTTGIDPTTGETRIGSKAGNYQTGLKSAEDPSVFSGKTYTSNLDTKFSNPNAGIGNVNAGLRNVNAGLQNVNAGLRSATYGNANQGLQAPVNYQQQKTLRDSMQQFQDPYTDRVVNQTIQDMDRARQMTANQISGDSAKAGAFGGSRSMLMQAENNRNFADRTAAAVGQLRSQGFQRAADLAQQENLQRLGLSASDIQQARGLQSQGNLQGQSLTANDLQNVRGLQSQGALTAQALRSQGALAAQGLQSQGALAAQALQSQGALAALNANANLYGQGVNLGAGLDQAALQANAGLLSDAMKLDAADLQQRRDIASAEAQFAESANRGAGALNLQGGTALGDLAQAGTADERQRIADMLASGQAGDMRGQQQADFDYQQFVDETQRFPTQYLNNLQQSGGLAQSLISGPEPQKNPYSGLLSGAGMGLSTYGALAGIPAAAPYALPAALGMGALGLLGG